MVVKKPIIRHVLLIRPQFHFQEVGLSSRLADWTLVALGVAAAVMGLGDLAATLQKT